MADPPVRGGRQQLADAVRRLIDLTVTSTVPIDVLGDVARRATALADELERRHPTDGSDADHRAVDHTVLPDGGDILAASMPFDVVIGPCNPLAPPITIEFDPPKAIGRVVFSDAYEGAPGLVHGAVLAGAFDIILTAANVIADGAGPTVSLSIRYLKPTRIGIESVFEGWVTRLDERRTHSEGRLVQGGVVTVEAVGEFVNMDRSRVRTLRRLDGPQVSGPAGGADPG
jgi:acyl-coenzyme A thioesterase PaaI-like protein